MEIDGTIKNILCQYTKDCKLTKVKLHILFQSPFQFFGHSGFNIIVCNLNIHIHTFRSISVQSPIHYIFSVSEIVQTVVTKIFLNDCQNSDNFESFVYGMVKKGQQKEREKENRFPIISSISIFNIFCTISLWHIILYSSHFLRLLAGNCYFLPLSTFYTQILFFIL